MIRIQVAQMACITVTELSTEANRSIMVQRSTAKYDFIITITINIAYSNVMVTLFIETLSRIFGLVVPALFQRLAVKVIRHHVRRRIVAANKDGTRMNAIKISGRSNIAFAAVTVVVAPVALAILAFHMLVDVSARSIGNRRDFSTISTTEHRQIFGALEHKPTTIAVILRLVANRLARTVNRTVSRFHNHFGLAVAVVIEHLELRVVRTRTNVLAQVDSPKTRAVELVGIDKHRARVTRLRVVMRIGRIPLQNQFIFTIAIEVGSTHVVRSVGAPFAIRHRLRSRDFKFQSSVRERLSAIRDSLVQHQRKRSLRLFLAIDYSGHLVLGRRLSILVQIASARRLCDRGNFRSIAIEIEFRRRVIRAEQAPAYQHSGANIRCDKPTSQVFHLTRCGKRRDCESSAKQGPHKKCPKIPMVSHKTTFLYIRVNVLT